MRKEVLILSVAMLAGCWKYDAPGTKEPELFTGSKGVVTFTSAHLPADPVDVYYNIPPKGNKTTMPIMIVLHGTNRTASNYLDAWIDGSLAKEFMVFAPEFQNSGAFAGSTGYNQGGMYNGSTLMAKEKWTFQIIEDLFDFIVADLGGTQAGYDMWGHSAGGQFVHRYILFMPEPRVNRAVAANSGWYTVTDPTIEYPYGLKNAPAAVSSLAESFTRKLYIQLGTADTDPDDPDLLHNEQADRQGLNRYVRGRNFWSVAEAESAGNVFNWSKIEVPGVAHNHRSMAQEAIKILY